ncbi:McrB family protein [Kaistella pullorum]|uniref:AAA family ATPase n=1 Tax=Kaistella pullorum TaxID=2763074 RepID=A0ABR8WMA1_9FLAO|nr:AAA family ATPase [Kaistella pullorum]MBD8018067.1 AAA family ATPase [Kaistella pullorum]
MVQNLIERTSELTERYIDILEQTGDPNENYKYLAINTFQDNWNLEKEDFYQMFRASFSKVSNLLYQNSWGFIEKAALHFPTETKEMFRNLYDEEDEISLRIKTFQAESESILSKVRQALNRTNIKTQQDERTISVYLAFRYPEKYILYKADYYKDLCNYLNIKSQKSGQRFLHLQALAGQIIKEKLLDDDFLKSYRKFYQKPAWDDKYLMIQNILYVVFRDLKEADLVSLLKDFNVKDLQEYYGFLDKIIENFGLQHNDPRLVFNFRKKWIAFTIGQRYIFRVGDKKSKEMTFGVIASEAITPHYEGYEGELLAYWNKSDTILEIANQQNKVFEAIEKELTKTQNSGYSKYNNGDLEQMAFDIDFRNEILGKLHNHPADNAPTKPHTEVKMPLNQILYGAPGTGKTYNTKKIAVEIINGQKERSREETNREYEDLINAKQIVFTTFHQSLSYEDFIEGIKPTMDENEEGIKTVAYEVKEGIFKELCNIANTNTAKNTCNNFDEVWNRLIEEVKNKIAQNKLLKIGSWEYGLSSKDSLKYSSVNSPSQYTFTITKQNIFDTYHDRQARPSGAFQKDMRDIVEYMTTNFNLEKYKEAKDYVRSHRPFVLIIDEINRGNVSAIFGELITLIEDSKRAGNSDALEVTLPYSKEKFSVPNNLYIIGTMNTADRSVEALDTALRRRFSFIEMQPNPEILMDCEYRDVDLKLLLHTINQRIEILIDKDHQIGHSYFIGVKSLEDLKTVFKDKIIPLLEEYFYGDFGKIGLVLGGRFIYQDEKTAEFPKNFTYEHDFAEDKKVYRFTTFESWNEKTFISVYED